MSVRELTMEVKIKNYDETMEQLRAMRDLLLEIKGINEELNDTPKEENKEISCPYVSCQHNNRMGGCFINFPKVDTVDERVTNCEYLTYER